METRTKNLLLAGGVVALALGALVFTRPSRKDAFGGTDDQAGAVVEALHPGYRPWASPLWTPPSPEVESLLFGLQSAVGAGALCYALGYWRGRRRRAKDADA